MICVLNVILIYPTSKINLKKLFVEIIFHLLKPFPFITYFKTFYRNVENDFKTIYTIDMFLLFFLRLYTILRCVLSLTNYEILEFGNLDFESLLNIIINIFH